MKIDNGLLHELLLFSCIFTYSIEDSEKSTQNLYKIQNNGNSEKKRFNIFKFRLHMF
jgi:hypothetical protein